MGNIQSLKLILSICFLLLFLVGATQALLQEQDILALEIVVMGFWIGYSLHFVIKRPHQVSVINEETSGNTGIFTIYNEEHMLYSHLSDYSVTPPSYDSIFQMNVSPPPYEVAVREENSNMMQEYLSIIYLE